LFLIVVTGAVFLVWYGGWIWIENHIVATAGETNAAVRGQFGDQFGAVNALFSGLAFAGIIFTLFLQRRDLNATRDAMSHERFDNTFFQLLNVHIAISEKVSARGGHLGKAAFDSFNEHLKSCDPDFHVFCALQKLTSGQVRTIIDNKIVNKDIYPELDDADIENLCESLMSGVRSFNNFLDKDPVMHERKIIEAYVKSASQYIDYFSHYFRNLYHILKFVDESQLISDAERERYSRFVRSQLSQCELVALFYNSIGPIKLPGRGEMELGHPKMGRILRRFDILQNMNPGSLFHPSHAAIFEVNNPLGDVKNAN
jgi:hypothetical protein